MFPKRANRERIEGASGFENYNLFVSFVLQKKKDG